MSKAVRVFLFFSIIIFLGVFLFVYANLPKEVAIVPGQISIEKDMFFYTMIILFVVINLLFTIISILFKNLKVSNLSDRKQMLRTWFISLPVMLNLYITFSVAYLGVLNNPANFESGAYNYLNYLGPILLIGWIFALFFVMSKSNQSPSESTN